MNNSLVAINMFNGDKLINKTKVPILFYWDGETNLQDDLCSNNDFVEFCINNMETPKDYLNLHIAYFYFVEDNNGDEDYKDTEANLQDILLLSKFNSVSIVDFFLIKHFKSLFEISFKITYQTNLQLGREVVIEVYNRLKERFGDRITKTTVINWVRSKLIDDNFNTTNVDYFVEYLYNILKNFE